MKPIFFAWTRSFWLTVFGIVLLIFGAPPDVLNGIAVIVASVTPWTPGAVGDVLNVIAPVALWLGAMQQRSGSARPYTLDPGAL